MLDASVDFATGGLRSEALALESISMKVPRALPVGLHEWKQKAAQQHKFPRSWSDGACMAAPAGLPTETLAATAK
jgi:hypothetical protein